MDWMRKPSKEWLHCLVAVLLLSTWNAAAQIDIVTGGCQQGQPWYAGDWAQKGAKLSLVKTGDTQTCSRVVRLEMVDEERFHSNPYADKLAIIVNFPPGPALVIPYVMGQRVYEITLSLPELPCDASPSCEDYIGSICEQQGVGFYYQLRLKSGVDCPGASEFIGIRDGETFNAPAVDFNPDPSAPCMPGNAASYEDINQAIDDLVAWLTPHPTIADKCVWNVNIRLAPNQKFRDSDYIDMVSFRGTGSSNYGAGTRMFFKGRDLYTTHLPGPADCAGAALNVEVVLLNEFLGAYPNYITGKNKCPFFSFKSYTFNKDQHYSFYTGPQGGGSTPTPSPTPKPKATPSTTPTPTPTPPANGQYAFPTEAECTTAQPPRQLPCPAMLSDDEVRRGFGAFYQQDCTVAGGSWAVYNFPGGKSCCRTCRWNKADAVAAHLQPSELPDCPACVQAYYEAASQGPVAIVPLANYVSDIQCPYPKPSGGDMSLPSWLYNPATGKCYYKSSFSKGISGNTNDATRRCQGMHGGQLLKVTSQAEDDFVRLNLLWTGFFGETYTGLKKPGKLDAGFVDAWTWPDGTALKATDYQRWGDRGFDYVEDVELCMEYLPQQPKTWNPFSCAVNKQYICERPATNPAPVDDGAGGAAPVDCSSTPAVPNGYVAPVMMINAGGPALCNYFAADTLPTPVATGGNEESWVGRDPSCASQKAYCTVRYGGTFSYSVKTVAGRSYRIRLTFTEVWFGAAGQRVFDVLVDGDVKLPGVDPYALAGGKFIPVVQELTMSATGANMVVGFQARADNALLAALEVFDMGVATGTSTPPASTPPASTPPASTPPASTPPASTPPASTPPASTPPASTPPASTPPASAPPASAPPASTPPASTPPASTPPASTPPASTPPASTPPASTPPSDSPATDNSAVSSPAPDATPITSPSPDTTTPVDSPTPDAAPLSSPTPTTTTPTASLLTGTSSNVTSTSTGASGAASAGIARGMLLLMAIPVLLLV